MIKPSNSPNIAEQRSGQLSSIAVWSIAAYSVLRIFPSFLWPHPVPYIISFTFGTTYPHFLQTYKFVQHSRTLRLPPTHLHVSGSVCRSTNNVVDYAGEASNIRTRGLLLVRNYCDLYLFHHYYRMRTAPNQGQR